MKYITFKQQFTYPTESVKGFAIHLGWQEKLVRHVEITEDEVTRVELEEYDNPQTFTEYVNEKAREHTLLFTKSWAKKLKEDYLKTQVEEFKATVEPNLDAQIIKPVEDALTSEVILS